jgi:NadR type nicotinamide-nucleotide adenylyltransferase
MENRAAKTGDVIRIVLTGPECTGKSTLAVQLARHYNTISIPEYARDYVENLNRPYTYQDVEHIAEVQLDQYKNSARHTDGLVFFDTYLLITKVWFDVVYKYHPAWIDEALASEPVDLFLLCDIDIPWIPDPVRENGGEMRVRLFNTYKSELLKLRCSFELVSGTGLKRLHNAINAVENFIRKQTMLQ